MTLPLRDGQPRWAIVEELGRDCVTAAKGKVVSMLGRKNAGRPTWEGKDMPVRMRGQCHRDGWQGSGVEVRVDLIFHYQSAASGTSVHAEEPG